MIRRSVRAVLVAVLLGTLVVPLPAGPVLAKLPDLTLVTRASYDVLPEEGRVAVTVRITATNRLRDTVARRFFFRTAFLAVQPGTSKFESSAANGAPGVSVRRRADDHTLLRIDLGTNLAAGRSRNLTLRFEIADPKGGAERRTRISSSLVSFEAWAFASPDTPGSSVTVTLPGDYDVEVGGGPLDGPTATDDGRQAWTSEPLDAPLDFVAEVIASRPIELAETSRTVALGDGEAAIVLRSWPDAPAWRDRVGELAAKALPVLADDIGLPWPLDGPLVIEESLAVGSDAGGGPAAGLYDPATGRLELSYAAPDGAILQQLAHAWFNGRLVGDRWIADAFALYYAERAGAALELEPSSPTLTPELESAALPLNAWSPGGPNGAPGSAEADAYAQAAGLALAREVGERAGRGELAEVWRAAASGTGAYQPVDGGDEGGLGLLDWRSLLDLLEDRTGRPFDDLWRAWVARPADLAALDARSAARAHHDATIARADGWALPRSVRDALRAWRFDLVEDLLTAADRVLAQRDALQAEAAAMGLTLPDRLERMFEGEDGFEVAEAEVVAQRAAIAASGEAREARQRVTGSEADVVVAAGLLGVDPEAQLATASAALAAGEVDRAFEAAATAEDLWVAAASVGRGRIVSVALLAVSVALLVGLIGWRRRGGVGGTS
ncbi:MAG: hypothetical protein FIA92_11650 [Chloroflexi bacterium]|nr:hypothetical protein [Chloroflexota bacterium]